MASTLNRDEPSLLSINDHGMGAHALPKQRTSEIGRRPLDESLPPLLRLVSTGTYPFLAKESPSESFEPKACSLLQRFSVADSESGDRNPSYDKFRSWSLRKRERDDEVLPEVFLANVVVSPRAYHSERASDLEIRNPPWRLDPAKKDAGKCNPPRFTFGRSRITPAFSSPVKFELAKKSSFEKERPKVVRMQEKWRSKPLQKFHSQPNPMRADNSVILQVDHGHSGPLPVCKLQKTGKDESYSFFRTKATKLEGPLSRMHSRSRNQELQGQHGTPGTETSQPAAPDVMPAGRYFDALKGPELEILRDSEKALLPRDQKWPFLLRFPIGCFGICLGLGSQTILWKTLATASSMNFLHVPRSINLSLWCLALMALISIFTTYSLKCIFYFEAVRREFYHPVRINFFFAPWIACMFLTLGVPPAITKSIHPALWCLFMAPVFILELKVYGEWLSGGERRLSKVANPSTHLSLVGNFVGAILAAAVGWKELAIFFWAVGLAHYLVLFVTLYQRLPTAAVLPKELHPVFFLFVAAPSTASVAWEYIVGDFDVVSRIAYFVGLFLYSSLVVRLNFFRGFRFSVAWWAYTFPMTSSAIASIHYSHKVKHPITQGLAVLLSFISAVTVIKLCLSTFFHIFFWGTMFPNDMAIAITPGWQTHKRKIKALDTDVIPSETSGEALSRGISDAEQFNTGKEQPHQLSLTSVKSDPLPKKDYRSWV